MSGSTPNSRATAKLFLLGYIAACVLFWWLPSLAFWAITGSAPEESQWSIWVSLSALGLFVSAYLLPQPQLRPSLFPVSTLDLCEAFFFKAIVAWSFFAFAFALRFGLYRWTVQYGEGDPIPPLYQAVLYVHMFLGFAFLGTFNDASGNRRRLWTVVCLTIAPRLFISLHWGRFYLAQALVPVVLLALARGWIRFSAKRGLQLCAVALCLFFVPALMRGNQVFGIDRTGQFALLSFIKSGSSLALMDNNRELEAPCSPLLVSLTEKLIPYSVLRVCTTDVGDAKNVPASLEMLLTRKYSNDLLLGSGSNYLLELYLTGGVVGIAIGTVFFALSCRRFVAWIGRRSLFAGIWAESLSRALLAPRGNLGYVYERIPSLLLATLLVIIACRIGEVLRRPPGPCAVPASD
jgi:hypothetical protein